MKKYIILLTLFFYFGANAQISSVIFSVSGKAGIIGGTSFGRLVKSYNEQNKDNLTILKNFGPGYGWSYNIDWITKGIYMGYYQHGLNAIASSKVNNYLTREFRLNQQSWGMDFGGGKLDDKGGFIIFFGIYYAIANLTADFKYRDGYRSVGAESNYNGIYHGFGLAGSLGAKIFRFKGHYGVTGGIRWCPMLGVSDMEDYGKGSVFANETLSEGWTVNTGKNLRASFQTVMFELGLAYKTGY